MVDTCACANDDNSCGWRAAELDDHVRVPWSNLSWNKGPNLSPYIVMICWGVLASRWHLNQWHHLHEDAGFYLDNTERMKICQACVSWLESKKLSTFQQQWLQRTLISWGCFYENLPWTGNGGAFNWPTFLACKAQAPCFLVNTCEQMCK